MIFNPLFHTYQNVIKDMMTGAVKINCRVYQSRMRYAKPATAM